MKTDSTTLQAPPRAKTARLRFPPRRPDPVAITPAPTPAAKSGRRGQTRRRVLAVVKHVCLILLVVVALYPVIWMLVSSLRPDGQIFSNPSIIPTTLHWENYTYGWTALTKPFSTYLVNSLLVVVAAIAGNLITCSMAAYAFARLKFRFQKPAFAFMLVTIMIPIHVVIVPQYILWSQLGLVNTFWPLIIPKFCATDAFFTFLMVQFIRGLPKSLDEAARIDGAGHGQIFFRILLPLMTPALATTTIFTFIWTWNDFFAQMIYLTDPKLYTVSIALRAYIDAQTSSSYGAMFAMSMVSIIPVVLIFIFGQKYLVQGIATTGLK
ncbi:MAG: carbohydrate ABC transporter permease [Propionibacteriaceae bacterium]|jgi:multiple sugar transport system permease protein|nr:carbohydrate ABC transporter permease [Propionibacteriaceae bacterium]